MFLSSQTLFWCQPCVPKSLLWTFTHTHPGKLHQKFCLTLPHPFFQISSYCRIVGRRGGSDHLPLISSHDSLSPQFPKPVLVRLAKSYSLLELHLTFCLFSEALPDVTIQRYQYKHTLCDSRLQCFYTFLSPLGFYYLSEGKDHFSGHFYFLNIREKELGGKINLSSLLSLWCRARAT